MRSDQKQKNTRFHQDDFIRIDFFIIARGFALERRPFLLTRFQPRTFLPSIFQAIQQVLEFLR